MKRSIKNHLRLLSGRVQVLVTDSSSRFSGQFGTVIGRNLKKGEGGYYDVVSFPTGNTHLKLSQYRIIEN